MRLTVVGAGVIGLAIAWRAAQRGAHVTVIDPDPGRGASWVAGGMLAPVAEVNRGEVALSALAVESARRWSGFAEEVAAAAGTDPGYTANGTLIVARDGDDLGELNDLLALQEQWGLAAERVTSRQARRIEPALSPTVRGALWLADDHQVDNRALVAALNAAAAAEGVGLVQEPATAVAADSVTTASGVTIGSDRVVVATGSWTVPIEGAETLPIRPVKGQILRVRATGSAVLPSRTVRGMGVYVVPRANGEIVIGATVEERGFDTTITAGAVHELLRDAWELVPGLAEAEFVEAAAGLRPGTPDNAPVLGAVRSGGAIVATGHYRNGLLLAPITADAVVGWLYDDIDRDLAALVHPFHPRRFARGDER